MTSQRQAVKILKRRAAEMSIMTGVPAQRILDEMISMELTPGQWAGLRGLDPVTFEPARLSETDAEDMLTRLWGRIRLHENAPQPPAVVLTEITALLEAFAQNESVLFEQGAPLLSELEEQNSILVLLHDLGARLDAEWLNSVLRKLAVVESPPFLTLQSQAKWDERQRRAVERRDGADA